MGGKYFDNVAQPLVVPRMGPMVYYVTKNRIVDLLKKHFLLVDCPLEAPEKKSFGDIDIVVQGPIGRQKHLDKALYELLLELLKPEQLDAETGNATSEGDLSYHAAIAWPEDVPEEPFERPGPRDEGKTLYIQLDIRVCKTAHSLRWTLFKHAHGDIWNMIGSSIRNYGLTVDEEAMYIRVPEIEAYNKKRARVALTSDPEEILDFLGLDSNTYWSGPFGSLERLFEFVAQGRIFTVADEDGLHDVRSFKANDRQRMNQRPVFRKWVEEFIPQCRKDGKYLERKTSREEITKEALARFNVEEEYNSRRREFLIERQKEVIWNTLIKLVMMPPEYEHNVMYRSCSTRALKRAILEGDEQYVQGPLDLKDSEGFFDEAKVRKFLEQHGAEIGEKAFQTHLDTYHAKKEAQGWKE